MFLQPDVAARSNRSRVRQLEIPLLTNQLGFASSNRQRMQQPKTSHDLFQKIIKLDGEENRRFVESQKERADLLRDLACDYESFKNDNPPRLPGTFEWFFRNGKFRRWKNSISGLLWVSAGPGCGKSVLTRALIDEHHLLSNGTKSSVCYFFFQNGDERRMYAANALSAILHQLFSQGSTAGLISHAIPSYKRYGKCLAQNFPGLWSILMFCATSPDSGNIVCILDGLDECHEDSREQLTDKLKDIHRWGRVVGAPLPRLKFLITSRQLIGLRASSETRFAPIAYVRFHGDYEAAQLSNDINLVIDARIDESARRFNEDDRRNIAQRLKSMKRRTHLWLHLVLDIIEHSPSEYATRSDVETLFTDLPSEISEAYEKILDRSQIPLYTEALLEIVLAAARPLTLDEANVASTLALAKKGFIFDAALEAKIGPRENFESIVENLCGSFIRVRDSKLLLVHTTAREFLTGRNVKGKWQRRVDLSTSHARMLFVCLDYLSYPDAQMPAGEIRAKFPFAQYSAQYWIGHAKHVETWEDAQEAILDFFLREERTYRVWSTLFNPEKPWDENPRQSRGMLPPLYCATVASLQNISELLLEEGVDVNSEGGKYGTALQAASAMNHRSWVRLLLKRGADPNARGGLHGTALRASSYGGFKYVTQLLLKYGADVNAQGSGFGNALQAASDAGKVGVMELLLNQGADPNVQGGYFGNGLQAASYWASEKVVKLLLKQQADVNAQGGEYGNALQAAIVSGSERIMHLLLERGANINAQGGYFGNALQAASFYGRKEVVRLLLKRGADVNTQGGYYGNALQAACYMGRGGTAADAERRRCQCARWSLWQCSPSCHRFR